MVLTGTYQRAIDDKGRFMLPKKLRDEIEGSLFLTPGTDRCLELHSTKSLQELAERTRMSAAGSRQIRSFSRLFYAQAEQCEIDSLGRVRMPKHLMEYALLQKEIVILGVGSNWEVWDAESWQSYLQSHEEEFDSISQLTLDSIPQERIPAMPPQSTELNRPKTELNPTELNTPTLMDGTPDGSTPKRGVTPR